jgi:hypothetical protein
MAKHAGYQAVKTAFTLYGAFFQGVAREIGKERALALHCELGGPFGRQIAAIISEKAAGGPIEVKTLSAVQEACSLSFGCVPELQGVGNVSQMTVEECPVYDGLRESGLDHATVEAICRGISATEYAALHEACPAVEGSLEFRSGAEGACVEHWALVK